MMTTQTKKTTNGGQIIQRHAVRKSSLTSDESAIAPSTTTTTTTTTFSSRTRKSKQQQQQQQQRNRKRKWTLRSFLILISVGVFFLEVFVFFQALLVELDDPPSSFIDDDPRSTAKVREQAKQIFPTLADKIYCINLKERDDRMQLAKERFQEVGLLNNNDNDNVVHFHQVDKSPQGGKIGCYEAHRQVIQLAYDEGLERALIFEDDIIFQDGWEHVVLDSKKFVEANTGRGLDYNVLYLGSSPIWVDQKTTPTLWKTKNLNTQAYIISRTGMKLFLENDQVFRQKMEEFKKGHDVVVNVIMQDIYTHKNYDRIWQDKGLGTDNILFPKTPRIYNDWLQITVCNRGVRLVSNLATADWYRNSFFGRRYVIGLGRKMILDDGKVVLRTLPILDLLLLLYLAVTTHPYPRGLSGIFTDLVFPFINRVLTGEHSL